MKKKQITAFENSLAFLSHPLALTALTVLLLNDHLFRRVWPSWLSGKLGDLAWLFVFPAFLVIPLSILIPNRTQAQARRVGLAAYTVVAVVFACANLFDVVQGAVVQLLENLLGTPIGLVRDPTDLFALVALIYSWKRWKKSQVDEAIAWRGIAVISMVALLTVANGPGPDVGIACLEVQDDMVIAQSAYYTYSSPDGGDTWTTEEDRYIRDCDHYISTECNIERTVILKASFQGDEITYRFKPCGSIEASRDGGDSWDVINPGSQFYEAERQYYEAIREGAPSSRQGPFDAVFDVESGNVIFAMGHQGVLLLDQSGGWNTVPVGAYVPYATIDFLAKLLFISGEAGMAILAGLLLVNVMTLDIKRDRRRITILAVVILLFSINAIVIPPFVLFSYSKAVFYVFYIVCGLLLIFATIERIAALQRSHRFSLKFMLILALISVMTYFLPFVLWLTNAIPNYHLALAFSIFSILLLYCAWRRRIKADPAFITERLPEDEHEVGGSRDPG